MLKNSANRTVLKYRVKDGLEIDRYQWKLLLLNIFRVNLILVTTKRDINSIHI